ncbi:transporter substrate-binding domain-containing protein [Paracoccus sp. SY]|uniref:transporter substrate-binding domain-containing protein n=1 Tax=Paracoccus sp. SY TaxID=1330255 RepID=UPI0013048A90|nr:transporter substrate-binding domain-containing protein [Paracoccus sp. SY]
MLGLAGLLALPLPGTAQAWTLSVCQAPNAAPYTRPDGTGIDDRVAAILADEMGADLLVVPLADRRARTLRRVMHAGGCDIVLSMPDKQEGFQTSQVYYATGFVFLTRQGGAAMPASLDDPALRSLQVGIAGDPQHPIPPAMALSKRGLVDNLHYFPEARLDSDGTRAMIEAMAQGKIDVAVMWGPTAAGLVASNPDLSITLVTPEIDLPVLPMVSMFTVAMRPGDLALRDDINRALDRRWDEIQTILTQAGIPMRPVVRRNFQGGGQG